MSMLQKIIVSALFVGFAAYEFYLRVVAGKLWNGYEPRSAWILVLLLPLWLAGAAGVWVQRYEAKMVVAFAIFALTMHGVVTSVLDPFSKLMAVAGVVQTAICVYAILSPWPGQEWARGLSQEEILEKVS